MPCLCEEQRGQRAGGEGVREEVETDVESKSGQHLQTIVRTLALSEMGITAGF